MLLTTIAGSLPKPSWLAKPQMLWARSASLTTVQGAGSPRMARYSSMSRIAPILLAGMDRSIARVAAYSTRHSKTMLA